MRQHVVIMLILVQVLASLAAPVSAYETVRTGPRSQTLIVNVSADANASYTDTFNASDPASGSVLNYNASVLPWMNASGVRGTFTGSWLPPSLWQIHDGGALLLELFGLARFKSCEVMSGSSYSWWRLPLEDPNTTMIELEIWHVDNPELVNWTPSRSSPVEVAHPLLVWDEFYNAKSATQLGRNVWWSNLTAWNYSHHWLWVLVVAPLHSDEHYAYKWSLGLVPDAVRPYFSLGDVGDDGLFRSWFYSSVYYTMQKCDADLDCSVVHQYGMGDAVSGFGIDSSAPPTSINFFSRTSQLVHNGDYLTFMMPFMRDVSNTSNAQVTVKPYDSSWSVSWWVAATGPTDCTVHSFQSPGGTFEKFRVNVTFQNQSNWIFMSDANSEFDLDFDDDGPYATNYFTCFGHANWSDGRRFYFRPYHALQETEGEWVNTHIPPVYILDGHVVNWSLRPNLDRSPRTPWYVKVVGTIMEIPLYIYWGLDWLLFDILPDLSRDQYWHMLDRVAQWLKNNLWEPLCNIGAWICKASVWLAENWSYILAGILMGINLIIFLPVWGWTILTIHGVKQWFLILVRDGPAAAGAYADEFLRNSLRNLKATPAGMIAGKAGVVAKAAVGGE